jgi:hypothetical protein
MALHATTEDLFIGDVNLELDKLDGELRKLFAGQPKRVPSFLSATRPRRRRSAAEDEGPDDAAEGTNP